jgi:hypothetical protein
MSGQWFKIMGMYWTAHVSALAGITLVCASYFFKTHRALTGSISLGLVAWSVHFLLLGAYTASALAMLSALRVFAGLFVFQLKPTYRRVATVVSLLLSLLVAYLTWQGWKSIPVTVGVLLATIGGYHFEGQALRRWLLGAEMFFLFNALLVGSELALIGSLASIVFVCIACWKHRHNDSETSAGVALASEKILR